MDGAGTRAADSDDHVCVMRRAWWYLQNVCHKQYVDEYNPGDLKGSAHQITNWLQVDHHAAPGGANVEHAPLAAHYLLNS